MDEEASTSVLRVMQWNILADGLAQNGDFIRSAEEILQWSTRSPKVLAKILESAADIVCLQELNHFDDFFLPQLESHGYSGIFRPKKYSPAVRYGSPPDGCAVFFRASRLQRLDQEANNKDGIICYLKDLQSNKELFVATVHLKAKAGKENDAIRLKQIQDLTQNLMMCTRGGAIPSILCGDFNTRPQSFVYKVMHEHSLRFQSVYACPREITSRKDKTSAITQSTDGGAVAEPPFTTWKFRSTGEKQETIDYIWFSYQSQLVPSRLWNLPSAGSIGANALPSVAMPSDHLPLLCEFSWKPATVSTSALHPRE